MDIIRQLFSLGYGSTLGGGDGDGRGRERPAQSIVKQCHLDHGFIHEWTNNAAYSPSGGVKPLGPSYVANCSSFLEYNDFSAMHSCYFLSLWQKCQRVWHTVVPLSLEEALRAHFISKNLILHLLL